MKNVKISPLSIVWIILLLYLKTPHLPEMLLAVVLHEAGHLFVARMLKIKIKHMKLSITGARIEASKSLSYIDELLFAMGGPVFGLFGFAITIYPALNFDASLFDGRLLPFSLISLLLSLFNLIPLPSLDGGRIVKCLVRMSFSINVADMILQIISFLTLFSIWLFSVYFLLKFELGLQMFVFCLIFFAKCFIFNKKNGDFTSF